MTTPADIKVAAVSPSVLLAADTRGPQRLTSTRRCRPWLLKGVGWTYPTHTPFSSTPIPLPAASFAPLEAGSLGGKEQAGRYHGGVGFVVIVRYESSPAGDIYFTLGL